MGGQDKPKAKSPRRGEAVVVPSGLVKVVKKPRFEGYPKGTRRSVPLPIQSEEESLEYPEGEVLSSTSVGEQAVLAAKGRRSGERNRRGTLG